jgi:hypothetical protein
MAFVICLGHYGFAIDGVIDGGKKATKTFSTIKSDLSFSLKSGYHFQNYMQLGHRRVQNTMHSNALITFQKGNITWVMPQKNRSKILQKFKTPTPGIRH